MKNLPFPAIWFVIFAIALLSAGALLATAPPRGQPVTLLPPPTPSPFIVEITGAVAAPGVYSLPPGSRVQAAIEAAGGLNAAADSEQVNLARPIEDGEKIVIAALGETSQTLSINNRVSEPAAAQDGFININNASLLDLQELPGIGAIKAERIIAYRDTHSGFKTIEELQEVEGIGKETFDRLKDMITID